MTSARPSDLDEGAPLRVSGLPSLGARTETAAQSWQMLSGLLQAARIVPETLPVPDGSVPLTILSGFLGAGKTTLLNRLLADPGGRRIAVLVNDFGRINIDAALIASRTEDMISLSNGCACCTVAGDLTRSLIDLVSRSQPPEAIILEASGLADPRGIAQVALSNQALRLDGVITLVDALHFSDARRAPELAGPIHLQLDAADLLVLTKTDEADAEQRRTTHLLLQQHYPDKPVLESVHGRLPVDMVLGVRTGRDPRDAGPVSWDHAEGFQSCSLESDSPLDPQGLRAFLAQLAPQLLRAKGVLHLQGHERRFVYHQVGTRTSLVPDEQGVEAAGDSRLVLIGLKGRFDAQPLQEAFARLSTPLR